MRIFPPDLEIGEHEGFDPKKDIFQRVEFGKGITNLLGESSDPLIIVLDEPWGVGKTTFIKMLAGHLRNEGFRRGLLDPKLISLGYWITCFRR